MSIHVIVASSALMATLSPFVPLAIASSSPLIRREASTRHQSGILDASMEEDPSATTTTVTIALPRPGQQPLDSLISASASSLLETGSGAPVVWCGGHAATECAACPAGYGPNFCNGECSWDTGTCYFRQDLFWCGAHGSKTCSECITPGVAAEQNVKWCSGDCDMHKGQCMSRSDIAKLLSVGEKKLVVSGTGLPSTQILYFSDAEAGMPLRHKTMMTFYDYGCCAFTETEDINMGPHSVTECMKACLNAATCVAADVGGPASGALFGGESKQKAFGCNLYSGAGRNFTTGCDESFHCYRKVVPGTHEP